MSLILLDGLMIVYAICRRVARWDGTRWSTPRFARALPPVEEATGTYRVGGSRPTPTCPTASP